LIIRQHVAPPATRAFCQTNSKEEGGREEEGSWLAEEARKLLRLITLKQIPRWGFAFGLFGLMRITFCTSYEKTLL